MPDNFTSRKPHARRRFIARVFMQNAIVTANESPVDGFRLITLQSGERRHVRWRSGQKIQVNQGGLFSARAYTPIDWDSSAGTCRLLVHSIGQGPGAKWAASVSAGEPCEFFPLSAGVEGDAAGTTYLFGDETSLASAVAMTRPDGGKLVALIEADDPDICSELLASFRVDHRCFARKANFSHLEEIHRLLLGGAMGDDRIVLTGRAASIQNLHQALRRGTTTRRLVTKAYWADGKTGLS